MNKIILFLITVCCFCSCVRDDNTIYYPVGDVNVVRGSEIPIDESAELVARSYNLEDVRLDTLAEYPDNPTIGKLTYMFILRNPLADQEFTGFNGVGKPQMVMSLGYKDGNFASESQTPIYVSQDAKYDYAVRLRLKGEFEATGDAWITDYICAILSSSFFPYPPTTSSDVFMCKGGSYFGVFNSFRRTSTFDITYERSGLSFDHLYFNLFMNLAGQTNKENIRLRIDKESYFEVYRLQKKINSL